MILLGTYGWLATVYLWQRDDAVQAPDDLFTVASAEMVFVSCLLAAGCIASDAFRCPRWRNRLWWMVAATGASVSLLGIVQHLGCGLMLDEMRPHEGFPFGPFNYHANAGSFLNLVLPLAIGLAVSRYRIGGLTMMCALAVTATTVIVCGIAVNVSRAAQVVAGLEMIALVILLRRANAAARGGQSTGSIRTYQAHSGYSKAASIGKGNAAFIAIRERDLVDFVP